MPDFVNDFFRRHYPDDADYREPDWCGGGVEQRYRGGSGATIFPQMKLADGLCLSVQGHFGAYSYPRGDFEESYSQVEIMGPPGILELAEWERSCNACGEEMIYPYVPVSIVNAMIAGRGGLARDSGSDRNGENSRSEVECEASQSGGEAETPKTGQDPS